MEFYINITAVIIFFIGVFFYWRAHKTKVDLKKTETTMRRQLYELAILKELGERAGYSLNVQKIINIISGSLGQLIEYSTVSYMLVEPENIIFKIDLEESVSQSFVDDVKSRMSKSLSALLDRDLSKDSIKEVVTGAIVVNDFSEPVRSFFNIPLVIGERVVGVLTVADTKAGLYREEDMTILYKITKQASLAVTRLQQVVQTEQKKLNAMVASMTEGVIMTDTDYRIIVANPAVKNIFNLQKKDQLSIFDFIDSLEGSFDIRGKLETSVKKKKILRSKDIFINNNFFSIIVAPVISNSGSKDDSELLGGVVIFHDITEEKKAARMREDFTSMMVHDLRSPLTGIRKAVEMMGSDQVRNNNDSYNDYRNMVDESAASMLGLVGDLLDSAKLEAGKFEVAKADTNIVDIINDRVSFYQPTAKSDKITLNTALAKDVPIKVSLDTKRITRVLDNLVSNALKFTKKSGTVTIQALKHVVGQDLRQEAKQAGMKWFIESEDKSYKDISDALVVAVTDTGKGIPANMIGDIFSKFMQLHSDKDSKDISGTGLGLSIVDGIVKAHGGVVGAASKEGEGSTFYFIIPFKK